MGAHRGYPREGGKEGELGGVISVKIERGRIGGSQ